MPAFRELAFTLPLPSGGGAYPHDGSNSPDGAQRGRRGL